MPFPSGRATLHEGSLSQYLKEISVYPLISRTEEVQLAMEISRGNEEAVDILVRSNLRFVVMIAKKYQNQGVPLPDLINDGNVGLLRAARKFDPTRGVKFISYAVWWIRQAIVQAIAEQGRFVRMPQNQATTVNRVGRKYASLLQELGRRPTAGEIAGGLDLSDEEVERALAISRTCLSLDAPISSQADKRLEDFIPDDGERSPDQGIYEADLRARVEEVVFSLDVREAKIVRLYYGLDGQLPMTLEEIGDILGITRERVRQIKGKALVRLRHASRARFLEGFSSS